MLFYWTLDAGCSIDLTCRFDLHKICNEGLTNLHTSWPSYSQTDIVFVPGLSQRQIIFDRLPKETMLSILTSLDLPNFLSLSSTCRTMRMLYADPDLVNYILKEFVMKGHLRWILPVPIVVREMNAAFCVAEEWLISTIDNSPNAEWLRRQPGGATPWEDRRFPWLAFIKACYMSDSMMNRKRYAIGCALVYEN